MRRLHMALTIAGIASIFGFTGCTHDMNYIIAHEPHFSGIVEKYQKDQYILVDVNEDEDINQSYDKIYVSLDVECGDSMTHFDLGDEVVVYYDGEVLDAEPAEVETVYAITLQTPANRLAFDPIGTSKTWSEAEIITMFESVKENKDWQYVDCAVVTDQAYEQVGVVLFWNAKNETSDLAFFDAEGYYQTCGIQAKICDESQLTYEGNGVVTVPLISEDENVSSYQISISIDGENVHFVSKVGTKAEMD